MTIQKEKKTHKKISLYGPVFKSIIYQTQCELFLSKPNHPSLQTVIFFFFARQLCLT